MTGWNPTPATGEAQQVRPDEASAPDRDRVVLAQIDESFHQVGGGVVHGDAAAPGPRLRDP
jgi:hypothetical protein